MATCGLLIDLQWIYTLVRLNLVDLSAVAPTSQSSHGSQLLV